MQNSEPISLDTVLLARDLLSVTIGLTLIPILNLTAFALYEFMSCLFRVGLQINGVANRHNAMDQFICVA